MEVIETQPVEKCLFTDHINATRPISMVEVLVVLLLSLHRYFLLARSLKHNQNQRNKKDEGIKAMIT